MFGQRTHIDSCDSPLLDAPVPGPPVDLLSPVHSASAASSSLWRCMACNHHKFEWRHDCWRCVHCDGDRYYDASRTVKAEIPEGTWMFMPRHSPGHSPVHSVESVELQPDSRASRFWPPPDPSEGSLDDDGHERHAESEHPTEDPVVDPDLQRPRRRRRRKRPNAEQSPQSDRSSQCSELSQRSGELLGDLNRSLNDLVTTLKNANVPNLKTNNADGSSSQDSWNSRKGPERGLRFRSGAPPAPPAWRYSRDDIRSFAKWQNKLQVWKRQIQAYMPLRDAALMLYTSLSGEPEEELEHIDLDRLHSSTGIDYVESLLKKGLETKMVYQKRKLMSEFETIVRQSNESMRAFVNRYRRAERALESVGVTASGMYDSESMGNRLLERSRLSPENGRLVLIGSAFNLSFEAIAESLCMSFPEHKPPPPLFGKDGQPIKAFQPRRDWSSSSSSTSASTSSAASQSSKGNKGKSKGSGKSGFAPRHAFATEHQDLDPVEEEQEEPDAESYYDVQDAVEPDGQPQQDEPAEEHDVDGEAESEGVDLQSVAEVLTVTAKKLQSITLGRKYSGNRSIQDRKRTSHCSACGSVGHWAGDAECTVSSKGAGKGHSKDGKSQPDKGGKPAKKVFFTMSQDQDSEPRHLPTDHPEVPNYFSFIVVNINTPVYDIMMTDMTPLVGFMILDTACQRMCCGTQWLSQQVHLLGQHRMMVKHVDTCEAFQFGRGQPIYAKDRVYMPVSLGGCLFLIGSSVVDTSIPLLASNTFLEQLDTVVDLGKQRVFFRALDVSVPIQKINGHLAVSISEFHEHVHQDPVWHALSHESFWKDPHPEIIATSDVLRLKQQLPRNQPAPVFAVSDDSTARSSMAAPMEGTHFGSAQLGAHDPSMDVSNGQSGIGEPRMVDTEGAMGDATRTRGTGFTDEERSVPPIGMHPSGMEEVRQSQGQFRQVHPVSHQTQMGSSRSMLGGHWARTIGKLFFAAALTFKHFAGILDVEVPESNNLQSQSQTQSQEPWPSIFSESFERSYSAGDSSTCSGRPQPAHGREHPSDPPGSLSTTFEHGRREPTQSRVGDGVAGDRQSGRSVRLGRGPGLNDGHRKYLIGKIRKARHALQVEADTYEALANKHRYSRNKVDILETFAGNALISKNASKYGLTAAMPLDYNTGTDLSTVEGQHWCFKIRKALHPLVLLQGLHCTPWLVMQENMNYNDRPEVLERIRDEERPTVVKSMEWCRQQHDDGNYYLIENPERSRIWSEESVLEMLEYTNGQIVKCHSGAYGGKNSKGQPIKKTFQFASNNPMLLEFLTKKLSAEQLALCAPLEGKEVTLSQHYPMGLVQAILKGIKKVAQLRNPCRFQPKQVLASFSTPVDDQQSWRNVMELASQHMDFLTSRDAIIQPHEPLYAQVQAMLPWQLTRVQVARRPLVNRHPLHFPYTHRGAALRYVDNPEVDVITEDLTELRFPRSRFKAPVELDIFWYGYPNEIDEEQGIPAEEAMMRDGVPVDEAGNFQPSQASQPIQNSEIYHDEITFPNSTGIDRSIKVSVSRMHKNLGHLPGPEMLKLLALNGITSDQVIKCIKNMQCAACARSRAPLRPNPAAAPPQCIGQFADNLQADIFYLRDLTSKNHPVLGVICEATHLHAATRLTSRNPSEVFEALRLCWLQNFGFPLRLAVGDDGTFKAEFDEKMSAGGTYLDVIPGEAHYKLGVIERHNGTLRMLLERIVDSMPCTDADDIDLAIVSALQAKNSATWSSGRPPYIAAFGKIPRVGTDLLSDPRALISGSSRSEAQQQSALMRCEALKAIAEASASSTLRRALLRKTSQQLQLEPQPGSLLAYWRWTTRSHRKRGGYRIARYLGKDPDGKTLWLQSGSHTVKVADTQVRDVFGYEDYVPDRQDLQALKNAEDNIRSDLWTDETLPEEVHPPDQIAEASGELDLDFEYPEVNAPIAPQLEAVEAPSTSNPQVSNQPIEIQPPQPPQQPSSRPSIHLHQNIQQTQNIFNEPAPGTPVPHTPSRRIRSRTPTQTRHRIQSRQAELTHTPDRHASTARASTDAAPYTQSTAAMPPLPQPHLHPSIHTAQQQTDPNIQPVVDLTDDLDDPGQFVPRTPPELMEDAQQAAQDPYQDQIEATSVLKRPFETLAAQLAQARRVAQRSYELYNYRSFYGPPLEGLRCWARLDLLTKSPKKTMSTGPSMSSVKWRRTLDATSGDIIFEGPFNDNDDEEAHHFGSELSTLTELWHVGAKQAPSFFASDRELNSFEPGWDGSPDNCLPSSSKTFITAYVNELAEKEGDFETTLSESDEEFDDMSNGMPRKTRKEQKAQEKELSWRDIMQQSDDYIQAFVEATIKEANSFTTWKSLQPIPEDEARRILNDPKLKKRIITSRGCYRDKNKNVPPLKAKTRIVCRGNQDPDLVNLTRQAPTPTRTSEMLVYIIFVSGANSKAFGSRDVWLLWCGDASTAFLQGDPDWSERAGKLYLKPPRDPIVERAKVFKSQLYEITGNIYGLSNAPYTWAVEVSRRLEAIGFICHSFDKMLFWFPDPHNAPAPCALLICYVDDFLLTHNSSFPFEKFQASFKWGSQQYAQPEAPLTFKGKEIHICHDGKNELYVKITQTTFINSLDKGMKIPKGKMNAKISDEHWPEFRSVSGCLQWLAGQCRLDLASAVSLSNRGSETTYADLDALNQTLDFAKSTAELGICIRAVPIDQSTVIVGYSDASWANAQGSASQHGQIIMLTSANVTECTSIGAIADWKTGRSKRVCRSTLAAEAVSADTATDRLAFLSYMLGELIFGIPAHRVGKRLTTLLVTDCKSLYDTVASPNPSIQDKRSLVNVRSIQELIDHRTVHWVPTHLQRADGLTKISKALMFELIQWLQRSTIQLRDVDGSKENMAV